jgi:hypothetical protein
MFDRATCLATRITSDPVVEFAALFALHELLAVAAPPRATASSLNTPVLSPEAASDKRLLNHVKPMLTNLLRGPLDIDLALETQRRQNT